MKAIVKATGKIIDVNVHGWSANKEPISYHHNYTEFFKPEELEIVGDICSDGNIIRRYRICGTYKGERVQLSDNLSCIEMVANVRADIEEKYPELLPTIIESYFVYQI